MLDALVPLKAWWPIVLGLLVLYVPTYWTLAHGMWNSDDHAHGPIVLVVALFLIWQQRAVFLADSSKPTGVETATGWTLLVVGLLAYALGRSQDIMLFEVGSQIPVILGALLITLGTKAARALWFALFFLLFMIPLPGFVVDAATGPLKQYISVIAEQVLYAAGYPIARSGVMLTVGQYQLLVADACSGLHSMFSLAAMGLLYLYLMQHTSTGIEKKGSTMKKLLHAIRDSSGQNSCVPYAVVLSSSGCEIKPHQKRRAHSLAATSFASVI